MLVTKADLLDHYVDVGRHEGYKPSAEFDARGYLQRYADVCQAKLDPLVHFIRSGRFENRELPRVALKRSSWQSAVAKIRNSGLFDEVYYIGKTPTLRNSGVDSVLHYLLTGNDRCAEPSPHFSMQAYIAEYPDVRDGGLNPLLHYIEFGQAEGRALHKTVQEAKWAPDRGRGLPDDNVNFEQMAAISFATRFGFTMNQGGRMVCFVEAIEELTTMDPLLQIDPIAPDVSIIIPVYGQLPYVLCCLEPLARHHSRFSVEIIVCDDATPVAEETERLAAIPWIRFLRRDVNGGFIDTCNWAAEQARGRFVVLLNSDTRVARDWLDELIGTFSDRPDAGLVGSKLFNADMTLQEAGGIFWADGTARNYGRNEDPNDPRFCFARQVDWCSGAAIAVPTALWRELGGFDTDYLPAYCEDVDIAFRIRARGYTTWYQPLARVIHYEGKTHGRDTSQGVKAYQVDNMKKIAARWHKELSTHGTFGPDVNDRANRPAKKRILIIDSLNPAPDIDSGSVVTMQMIRSYQKLGFGVTFIAQSNDTFDPKFGPVLQRSGVECLYGPFVGDIHKALDNRNSYDFVLIYRVTIAATVFDIVRERLPTAPILFHNIDLHYLREMRAARVTGDALALRRTAQTKVAELGFIARADCAIVTSPAETEEIQAQMPRPINTIVEMPICVDVNMSAADFHQRNDIMFLAGFAHPPNIDAATFLAREIWPLVCDRLPAEARLLIVGSNPSDDVKALAGSRIIVTGYVPELHPWFDRARVFVAPLRFGAGIKGKVIQALAHGVPSVMTAIAAEGIGLQHGRDALIADEPQLIANALLELYSDQKKWVQVQQAGYDYVTRHLSSEIGTKLCRRALDVATAAWSMRSQLQRQRILTDILDHDSGAECVAPVVPPADISAGAATPT
ncbi:glycosyltransferase [Tardiphaga sp. vice278]|uniref:glycosyltransferase n=1 Tax=Tardiphaga sp. vice278 TaxID=2592815 RepID=UPI00143D61BA|nr:glycosyltransferase [Tardiphaga sp. vice278]